MLSGESPCFLHLCLFSLQGLYLVARLQDTFDMADCGIIVIFSGSYWALALWVPCFLVVTLYRIYLFVCRCLEDPPLLWTRVLLYSMKSSLVV